MTDQSEPTASWLDPFFCPIGRRRRGAALEQAIYAATLAQLAEHGLPALTMEGVAAAARTGKASLYRRWSSKEDLLLDAVGCAMPQVEDVDTSTGSLRDDLLHVLTQMAAFLSGPGGQVVRNLLAAAEPGHPLLEMARVRLVEPRLHRIKHLIELGIDRGEASPGTATITHAQAGPALAIHRYLLYGRVTEQDVREIVDVVVLPLLQPARRFAPEAADSFADTRLGDPVSECATTSLGDSPWTSASSAPGTSAES